jgi:uncharacterized protein (UPF0332 family)
VLFSGIIKMNDSEIEHWLQLAHDDLKAAEDNLQLGYLRVATSRGYYAMFYAATALLGSEEQWRSKHQGVVAVFGELFVKTGRIEPHYGRMLHKVFSTRLDSDYKLIVNLDSDFVRQVVEDATNFVQRIERILDEYHKQG